MSSDDDMPLSRSNGHLSAARISKADDSAMDIDSKKKLAPAGISIRNGPIEEDSDDDAPLVNGNGKRKSRSSIAKVSYKADSDSDDSRPLAKRQRKVADSDSDDAIMSRRRSSAKLPPAVTETANIEDSDDDVPLTTKLAQRKKSIEKAAEKATKKPAAKKAVKDESDDDVPLSRAKGPQRNGTKAKSNGVKKEESDSDTPIRSKVKAATAKDKTATSATKRLLQRKLPRRRKVPRPRARRKRASTSGGTRRKRKTTASSGPLLSIMVCCSRQHMSRSRRTSSSTTTESQSVCTLKPKKLLVSSVRC